MMSQCSFRKLYQVKTEHPHSLNCQKPHILPISAYHVQRDAHQFRYSDVIMNAMAFQINGVSIVQPQIKENIKAPRHMRF